MEKRAGVSGFLDLFTAAPRNTSALHPDQISSDRATSDRDQFTSPKESDGPRGLMKRFR